VRTSTLTYYDDDRDEVCLHRVTVARRADNIPPAANQFRKLLTNNEQLSVTQEDGFTLTD
jgi:hypothetical protein